MLYFGDMDKRAQFYQGWLTARYGNPRFIIGGMMPDAGPYMAALAFCPEYRFDNTIYDGGLGKKGNVSGAEVRLILLDHLAEINPRDFARFATSEASKNAVSAWEKYLVDTGRRQPTQDKGGE